MKSKLQLFEQLKEHLLMDHNPSVYFNALKDENFFTEFPFTLLSNLKNIMQSPLHHPEGNVWNHTMLVIDIAAKMKGKSRNSEVFMWAALLHDIGKADTTKNRKGKITSYDHDILGADQSKQFLQEFIKDKSLISDVWALVRWHMQILFVVKSMKFAQIEAMRKEVNIHEVALLGYCDRMGRLNAEGKIEEENIRIFIEKCQSSQ